MANRITEEDKVKINELYLKYKTYAEVARQTGFSAGTVKKYIIPNFVAPSSIKKIIFTEDQIPQDIEVSSFLECENFGNLLELSQQEIEEIKELWKELII